MLPSSYESALECNSLGLIPDWLPGQQEAASLSAELLQSAIIGGNGGRVGDKGPGLDPATRLVLCDRQKRSAGPTSNNQSQQGEEEDTASWPTEQEAHSEMGNQDQSGTEDSAPDPACSPGPSLPPTLMRTQGEPLTHSHHLASSTMGWRGPWTKPMME